MREIVERNTAPVYENFGTHHPCNGESGISEENGSESREEENSSIEENSIPNGDNHFDHQNNEGVEHSEESSPRNLTELPRIRSASSSVKSLAKSLELVSNKLIRKLVYTFNLIDTSLPFV